MTLYLLAALGGFVLGMWTLIASMTWYLMYTEFRDHGRYKNGKA